MKAPLFFAIIFAAIYPLSTGAMAQKVYRCGNNYSQTPCPDAVVVEVQDARSTSQKNETDARIRRETATADAMEKKRLQEEAEALADGRTKTTPHAKTHTGAKKTTGSRAAATADPSAPTGSNAPPSGGKKKPPPFFTARVAPDKKKTPTPPAGSP